MASPITLLSSTFSRPRGACTRLQRLSTMAGWRVATSTHGSARGSKTLLPMSWHFGSTRRISETAMSMATGRTWCPTLFQWSGD